MNNFDLMTKFLLTCAGVDHATMTQCTPSEVRKYKIMGTCVLIPSLLGLFSGGYTMYLVSGIMLVACLIAPIWAWVIFTLDRAVVATTRPGKLTFGVLGRILLAVIIAFTISEPVILKVFSDAIEDKRLTIIDEKQTNAIAKTEEQITAINNESKQEKNKIDNLDNSYIQEVDGTGGSRVAYRGPIAEVKWQAYQAGLDDYNKNEMARKKQLSTLEVQRAQKLQTVSDKDAKGFLGNLRILGRLMDEDTHVWWCVWLVRLLFLSIELIPVFIKLGSASDYDLYNKIKDTNDINCFDLQKLLVEEKRDVMKMEQSVIMLNQRNELKFQEMKAIMNSKTKDFEYFMDKVRYAMDQQLKIKAQVIEKVKDENIREELLGQLTRIYESYVATLEALVLKSKEYHTSAGID
jgi:hypothetical protein